MPRLYFSRRRMLNRLSFRPQEVRDLIDHRTGQTRRDAFRCLLHLEEMGLAERGGGGWRITDAGVAAMAANGVIYAEDAAR